jgi:DNA-directed RNA polymerase subunit N (RpoN/RPB10)
MSVYILCPSCGNCLGEYYEFINIVKNGYYKSLNIDEKVNINKIEICPNITKPIGFILDAVGLNLMCCRMHILGATNFEKIYK